MIRSLLWSRSMFVKRRHLSESQRAMIAARIATLPKGANQHVEISTPSQAEAAERLSVSRESVIMGRKVLNSGDHELIAFVDNRKLPVSLAAKLAGDAPEFRRSALAKMKAGERPATAVKMARQDERREIAPPEGCYSVVVIDPPWPMEKIEREIDRHGDFVLDYPTMTLEEIAAMTIPAADDCHLFCWTTQRFLFKAAEIIEQWGFRIVFTMVWKKPGGFQPFGLPQYNVEFAIYARKGTPEFQDTKAFFCGFDAPRGRHSEKPQEFYDLIARATNGRRIDMFARQERPGWNSWGNEAPGQPAPKDPAKLREMKANRARLNKLKAAEDRSIAKGVRGVKRRRRGGASS